MSGKSKCYAYGLLALLPVGSIFLQFYVGYAVFPFRRATGGRLITPAEDPGLFWASIAALVLVAVFFCYLAFRACRTSGRPRSGAVEEESAGSARKH